MKMLNLLFVLAFVFAMSSCGGKKADATETTTETTATDNHGADNGAAKLDGAWNVVAIGAQALPEGAKMVMTFTADGKISMTSPEGKEQEATYKVSADGKIIDVTSKDGEEKWEVKSLTATELVIHDQKSNEDITLKR